MVSKETIEQYYYRSEGTPPVTFEDVELFLRHDMQGIEQRFAYVQFLPNYLANEEKNVLKYHSSGLIPSEKAQQLLGTIRTSMNSRRDCWARREYEMAAYFIDLAFRLRERLQNSEDNPITYETVGDFGFTTYCEMNHLYAERLSSNRAGVPTRDVTAEITFEIPSCEYVELLSDACDKMGGVFLDFDGFIEPLADEASERKNPIIGWAGNTKGVILTLTTRFADSEYTPRWILESLLKMLFDLHLCDIQMLVNGYADYTLVSPHALGSLWVKLREEFATGRAGICPVCGTRFIAHGEKGERRRFCDNPCKMAYSRTKQVLSRINAGRSIEDAASSVSGIGLKRAAAIATRNRDAFAAEFPNVDFDALAERR